MKVRIQKVSSAVLYVMLAITIVVLVMFYAGGEAPDNQRVIADATMSQPTYTDTLIYWIYVLLGTTILVTVIGAIYQFVSALIDSPVQALKSLIGIILLVVVMVISWNVGSGDPLNMPAYDGAENVYKWLKLTDMFLYTIYTLMVVLILLMFGFGISKKFK
ncbi:MAG: hypothetical protein LBN06_00445 [Prevotellaceae bacterium]|jgi:hypothetical protein|nr:hypothetical protein [Prevotellaceae bacterium]